MSRVVRVGFVLRATVWALAGAVMFFFVLLAAAVG